MVVSLPNGSSHDDDAVVKTTAIKKDLAPHDEALSASVEAEALKRSGNQHYISKNYQKSIEFYTKAINLTPNNPFLYTNRSQANLKNEAYQCALDDAELALKINDKFSKGYWRHANACIALNKYEMALKSLEILQKMVPSDMKVAKLFKACSDHCMQLRLNLALSTPSQLVSAFDELDVTTNPPSSYSGPVFEDDDFSALTIDDVKKVIQYFKDEKKLHHSQTSKIILKASKILKELPNVVHIDKPHGERRVTICGDVHGQFFDFINIFELNGYPSENNVYLFNGDFVDRGAWSLEIITIMLLFKILYPNGFFMNRGNHEGDAMNHLYGFKGEVNAKFDGIRGQKMYNAFRTTFELLPLAHIVGDKIFVVHGGVPMDGNVTIDEIQAINRFIQIPDNGIMCDMLWADPHEGIGLLPSDRGMSNKFGYDVTQQFLSTNELKCIVRSHEMKMDGHAVQQSGRCYTIFSAPNYCDYMSNKGAYIVVSEDLELDFKMFDAVAHPACNPQQYCNSMSQYF